jgi:hypothetical protein
MMITEEMSELLGVRDQPRTTEAAHLLHYSIIVIGLLVLLVIIVGKKFIFVNYGLQGRTGWTAVGDTHNSTDFITNPVSPFVSSSL